MPQLNFYVPEDVADEIRRKAEQQQIPVSKYLADLVKGQVSIGPPASFLATFGAWDEEWPEVNDPPPDPVPGLD